MPVKPSPLRAYVTKWQQGCGSPACARAQHVVLGRGSLPCHCLFIGEAPGESEDVLGQPFVGPAGKLLDKIIASSIQGRLTYALTNLVGCLPLTKEGTKAGEPEKDIIKQCLPRLVEFVQLAKPRLIVCVGSLSQKSIYGQSMFEPITWLPPNQSEMEFVDIIHPAAILRMNVVQQGAALRQCVARLNTAADNLLGV